MAKPNKKNNYGSAFFDPLIKSKGDTFMIMERPERLMKKVPLLLKDLAYGNITEKYNKYFTYDFVTRIVIPALQTLYLNHLIHFNATEEYYRKYGSPDAFTVMQTDGELLNVYGIALSGFNDMVASNGNLGYLISIGEKLKQHKFII
jgi:hypothetical protein